MAKQNKIENYIQKTFRTFGGGEFTEGNPVSIALKDRPLQFAAGVDVDDVIRAVLKLSGQPALLEACKKVQQYAKSAKAGRMANYASRTFIGKLDADIATEHWESVTSYVDAAIAKAEAQN